MSEPIVPDPEQLHARFVPVIEQAKGIIMAQCRCGPEAAFEILCGISQHTNVKLHVLAERMVQQMPPPVACDDLGLLGRWPAGGDGTRGPDRHEQEGPRCASHREPVRLVCQRL